MNGNGIVEIPFRGSQREWLPRTLAHFRPHGADDMAADDFLPRSHRTPVSYRCAIYVVNA